MSRRFDGVDDQMVFAVPAAGLNVNGAHTLLIVVREVAVADNTWQSYIETETSGAVGSAVLGRRNNGNLYWGQGVTATGGANVVPFTDSDSWSVAAASKAAGSSDVTMHKCVIGGTNTHTAFGTPLAAAASIASGTLRLGGNDDFANMRVAAAAIFDRVLSNAEIEGIKTAKTTQSIYDLGPVWLVDDNDAFVSDYMGHANRTSITGTADDADDPTGWVYGISAGGTLVQGAASMALTMTRTTSAKALRRAASATALTLTRTTAGRQRTKAASALALVLARTTSGTRRAKGAAALALALSTTTSAKARVKAASSTAYSMAFSSAGIVVGAVVTVTGAASMAISATLNTAARRRAKASSSSSLTFTLATAARRRATGASSTVLTVTRTTVAKRHVKAATALAVSVLVTTSARRRTHAAASMALTFVLSTIGLGGGEATASATTRTGIRLGRTGRNGVTISVARSGVRISRTGRNGVEL